MTTTTPTSGAAIQRYKIGYHADKWGQRSSTPSSIPDASGSWVRYADHVTALAAGQATAPQGVAYAALPEYGINTASHAHFRVIGFTADQMRAFADATHALRASRGQAPAQPFDFTTLGAAMRAIQQAIGLIGDPADERMQAVRRVLRGAVVVAEDSGDIPAQPDCLTCNDHGAVGNILTAEPCPDCTRWNVQPAQADSVQEDAARGAIDKVLALFPFNVPSQKFTVNNGPCLTADNDDEFYSVKRVLAILTEIKTTLDAARKQGGV